ncbi:hypothetical protein FRC03_006595 [Tulasnella sp. 419]|nr:hypothetical protein FRC03_006595 [Tulasnella sp. 419]
MADPPRQRLVDTQQLKVALNAATIFPRPLRSPFTKSHFDASIQQLLTYILPPKRVARGYPLRNHPNLEIQR